MRVTDNHGARAADDDVSMGAYRTYQGSILPLINTVEDTADAKALPQVQVSPLVAAARPSKKTSGDPDAIAFGPCPGIGQLVGSVIRAAGFAMLDFLSTILPSGTVSDSILTLARDY